MSSSTINQNLIFNFNTNDIFDLSKDYSYFQRLNEQTQLLVDPTEGIIAFRYNNSKTPGGLILKMATIPGVYYHLYTNCQLIIGNVVQMQPRNKCPEINLACEIDWPMGDEVTKTIVFQALSNQTELIISTNVDVFCNLAPYEFHVLMLTIIPACLLCQGYIQGSTGATGPQGPQGLQGPEGSSQTGTIGNQGVPGPQGFKGLTGARGETGINGNIGSIGTPGFPGTKGHQEPPDHQQVPQDCRVESEPLVPGGPQGPQGLQGYTGVPAYRPTPPNQNVYIGEIPDILLAWYRGGSSPVALNVVVNYQKTGQHVSIKISEFVCVGSYISGIPVSSCLTSQSLPASIRLPSGSQNHFPCIIEVNGLPIQSIIQFGPSTITIYQNLQFGCAFTTDDVVFFPTQFFNYQVPL